MGLAVELLVDQISVRRVENSLHETFSKNILDSAKENTPHDPFPHREGQFEGDMMDAWMVQKPSESISEVTNTSPQTNILLGGSGIYRGGQPICRKVAPKMIFPWRWKGYQVQARTCVKGVNPRAIRGDPGHVYDFKRDMEESLDKGVKNAVQEWNE